MEMEMETEMEEIGGGGDMIDRLPEECIAHAISLTSPGDACHSSAVSPAFHAAADSDAVWERFLPSDYAAILWRAVDPPMRCSSKKELFFRLCDQPVFLDDGKMSFALERRSGAKCYMLSARALTIVWGDQPLYWKWTSLPGSRFPEVAELMDVCWLEIRGKIRCAMLSPRTTYKALLVFKIADDHYGLDCHIGIRPPKSSITVRKHPVCEHAVCFQHSRDQAERAHRRKHVYTRLVRKHYIFREIHREAEEQLDGGTRCPRERGDRWMEVEMGEFFVADADDEHDEGEVEITLTEVEGGQWKKGLIVQGIEIRPKNCS